MEDELNQLSRDPRFAGKLKKTSRKEKEALKSLFSGIGEETAYKDKRGRPWPKKPITYAKKLLQKESLDKEASTSESEAISISGSDSTASSDEGVEEDEEQLADLQDADWCSLTRDAKETDNISKRLAILHFDWDNATAETIFMALESFLPAGSCLDRVTIYPSEYGMRRMADEAQHGPKEIWEPSPQASPKHQDTCGNSPRRASDDALSRPSCDLEADEKKAWKRTSVKTRHRLRRYQLTRLKYFYAIAEFDSPETAAAVYEACDSVEYASTGIRFDLRFVDDSEQFSVPAEWAHMVSECSEVNKSKYVPRVFETPALHSTRITLSWDKTPGARTEWLCEQFGENADPKRTLTDQKKELAQYLALSSSGQSTAAPSDVDEPAPAPTVPRIHKHRPKHVPAKDLRAALLSAIGADVNGTYSENEVAMLTDDDHEEVEEEVEEVMDLAGSRSGFSEDEGDYDLTSRNEDKASARSVTLRRGRLASRRKRLAESSSDEDYDGDNDEGKDDDDDLDFADMENRLSDDDLDNEKSIHLKRSKNSKDEIRTAAKKKRSAQRTKMMIKRKKSENSREKLKHLWAGADTELDSRFDDFFHNPEFGISQLHRSYKDANEFVAFMRQRKTTL